MQQWDAISYLLSDNFLLNLIIFSSIPLESGRNILDSLFCLKRESPLPKKEALRQQFHIGGNPMTKYRIFHRIIARSISRDWYSREFPLELRQSFLSSPWKYSNLPVWRCHLWRKHCLAWYRDVWFYWRGASWALSKDHALPAIQNFH